jgi:hypothetical protein
LSFITQKSHQYSFFLLARLQTLQERVLLLQLFLFSAVPSRQSQSNSSVYLFTSSTYPAIGTVSRVMDPLCCNSSRTSQPFLSTGQSFALINGALKPVIRLQVPLPPASLPFPVHSPNQIVNSLSHPWSLLCMFTSHQVSNSLKGFLHTVVC